jgi:hypothetical protein
MRPSSLSITIQYGDADRDLVQQAADKVSALALAKANGREKTAEQVAKC